MRFKSEQDILADIRRLRHQLDRQRLTRTQAALKAAQQELETLRAKLADEPRAETPPRRNGA